MLKFTQTNGALDWIRTSDLFLRRETLYPPELQEHDTYDYSIGIQKMLLYIKKDLE